MKKWEKYPELKLPGLDGGALRELEARRRLRQVRYLLFRLQTQVEKNEPLMVVQTPPGFVEFWLGEKPKYRVDPRGRREPVAQLHRDRTVADLGGYKTFAKLWDVDADLMVYLRHSSVWQEWNARLMRVVPVIGGD